MKNILVPSDLTLESLYPVHEICKQTEGEKCNIYIIHTLLTPSGIMDLLFLQESKMYDLLPPGFMEAVEMLRKKYGSVLHSLSFEFLWSNSRGFLRNYTEAKDIHSICMLKDYPYRGGLKQSADCIRALKGCKLPVQLVERSKKPEYVMLTALLYRQEKMHA